MHKFENLEDGWDNFRKAIYEVADDVLGRKVKSAAGNTRDKTSCLIERRRDFHKNYLSDRS